MCVLFFVPCHVRLRSFPSMTPCIFWPFLSFFSSFCVVFCSIFCLSALCPVYCVLYLAFLLVAIFSLINPFSICLSCPAPVFLSWLCIPSCLLLYKRHLFWWIRTKKRSRHSVSTISAALFCSLSWHSSDSIIRIFCPLSRRGWGGGVRGDSAPARALVFLNMP